MADRCSFGGSTAGPFHKVDGLFTVLMGADCQAARGHGSGPYPVITRAEMRDDPETRAYAARRGSQGKSARDVRRCLKRAVARQLFKRLERLDRPGVELASIW